jgi:hypothetical protein
MNRFVGNSFNVEAEKKTVVWCLSHAILHLRATSFPLLLQYFVCLQLYVIHELLFTFTTMALAKYMAYFHYNFHCCTSVLLVLIYVRHYCGDFIFFTDETFIVVMFIVLRINGLLQSKNTVVTIAICTALFQFWCLYCDFSVAKLAYKKEKGFLFAWCCLLAVEIIWLVPEISLNIYSNTMNFNKLEFSAFIFNYTQFKQKICTDEIHNTILVIMVKCQCKHRTFAVFVSGHHFYL